MTLGEAIRDIRKKQGLSQQELASAAGITQTALSKIEKGARPGAVTLTNLSKVLKTPEPMIHLLTIEEGDIPESRKYLYAKLFPVVRSLILEIAGLTE